MLNRSTTCCWLVPVNGEELELVVTVVGLVGRWLCELLRYIY